MLNVADLVITSLDTLKAYSLTGDPRFVLDELQNTTISNTLETTDITGKQGRRIGTLKRNKGVTVSGTNGILSAGLMEAQTGSRFETLASTPVEWIDYLTINDDSATTEYVATGTPGEEISEVYVLQGGVAVETLTQAVTPASGKFAYDPSTKTISFFADDYDDGTEIVVFYTRAVAGNRLANESDTYSEKCRVYIDGTAEDKCGNVYYIQFFIPKGDFNGNFDIALGGDQAVHNFELTALAGSCGNGSQFWTLTVFGAGADTATTHKITYRMTGSIPADNTSVAQITTEAAAGSEVTVRAAASTTATTYGSTAGTFAFGGWQTTDASVSSGTFTMPDTDVVFTGNWTFTPEG